MATIARQESESLRMKGGQANARRTRTTRIPPSQASRASQALSNISNVNKAVGKKVEEGDEEKQRSKEILVEGKKGAGVVKPWESCRVGASCDRNGKDANSKLPARATKPLPGHGQVSVKGRERETKGRERNKIQVRERREMQGREKGETLRGERETHGRERKLQTQGRGCRDLQGRGKKVEMETVQMETVKCGRAKESTRPPDTTLLRPAKVTVVLTEDSTKQILAGKRVFCLLKKETANLRSIADPVGQTAQEIAGHTQLVESSEATTSDLRKPDIDLTDDPAMCEEYSLEIYQYQICLENEDHYTVQACFLDHQVFTAHHRQTLVDWLIQVHLRFKLLHETLFLTVDIMDRYLQVCL